MKGLQETRQALAAYLEEQGVAAVTAWQEGRRLRPGRAVAAVSLRGFESGPPGFQDYLGERYNAGEGRWEELYGKKVELIFGLDLYGATAEAVQKGLDGLNTALSQGGPEGLRALGVTSGETVYQGESGRYFCPVQARFFAWMTAVSREDGSFLDFEVRGEKRT